MTLWEGTPPWDPPLPKMWRSRGFSNGTVSKSCCDPEIDSCRPACTRDGEPCGPVSPKIWWIRSAADIHCAACRGNDHGDQRGPAAGAGSDEHRRRSRRDNREARSKRNRGWIGRNLRQDYERIRDRAGSSERIAGLGGPGRSSADTGWLELRRPIWDDPCLGT